MPPASFRLGRDDRIASRTRSIIERRDHSQFRRSLQSATFFLNLLDLADTEAQPYFSAPRLAATTSGSVCCVAAVDVAAF
jgi:hypothetical protein